MRKEIKIKRIDSTNATVISLGDNEVLVSYSTPVAAFIQGKGYFKTERKWSNTTSKHVNRWLSGVNARVMPQEFFDDLMECQDGDEALAGLSR